MIRPKKTLAKKRKNRLGSLFAIALLSGALLLLLSRLDKALTPIALDIAERKVITDIDGIIDDAYSRIIEEQHIESIDLFNAQADEATGKVSSMYIDTLLVNKICNNLAVRISTELNEMSKQSISVPMGSLSGYQIFADMGPAYRIHIQPAGKAVVDPRSESETVGINQVIILVWLDVRCEARIVTPYQSEREIAVTRSLPLVNTYFSQEVPNTYWSTRGGSAIISDSGK
ncbi:MAG: sporulation protein YunB [Clostridiales bacterium]|nr:sporulation protein YunB [Clostridiales bacterium]